MLALVNTGCDSAMVTETAATATENSDHASLGKRGVRASGSGEIAVTSNGRTFAFTAVELPDGRATGQLSLDYKQIDVHGHGVIDCLAVDGNVATMSGTVTTGSYFGEDLRGLELAFWFRAEDNGEPGINADRMTGLWVEEIDLPSIPDCTGELPFTPTLYTIATGNINVGE